MKKLVLLFLFTALTAAGLLPQSASAQVERGSETVYIRPQVGISYYMGDNEKSPFNFDGDMFDTFPYNLGAELGVPVHTELQPRSSVYNRPIYPDHRL